MRGKKAGFNRGSAFIDFSEPTVALNFQTHNHQQTCMPLSAKPLAICPALIQGFWANRLRVGTTSGDLAKIKNRPLCT